MTGTKGGLTEKQVLAISAKLKKIAALATELDRTLHRKTIPEVMSGIAEFGEILLTVWDEAKQ